MYLYELSLILNTYPEFLVTSVFPYAAIAHAKGQVKNSCCMCVHIM